MKITKAQARILKEIKDTGFITGTNPGRSYSVLQRLGLAALVPDRKNSQDRLFYVTAAGEAVLSNSQA